MKTTAQITKVAVFCLLAAIQASLVSAQTPSLENLVSLSRKASTASAARDELRRLTDRDPADARVPYVYSLVLVDRLQYGDALGYARQATTLDPGNLNAWKMRIWLSVSSKDVDDALASMEQLSSRMPKSTSPAGEQICQEFSGFMGKVFGYLAGPHAEKVSTMQVASVERRVVNQLTPARKAVFLKAREQVIVEFETRVAELAKTRAAAVEREARSRNEQLANLADEYNYSHRELEKIESLRLAGRKVSADERNVIAATREKSVGGSRSGAATNYRDAIEQNPIYHQDPNAEAGAPSQFDHEYDRYRGYNHRRGAASGWAVDRGLDDRHYADVNRRDAEYAKHLSDREAKMHRRLRRIAKDQAKQIKAPNGGSNNLVRALTTQAQALTTYLPCPVSPAAEIETILATS